MKKTKATIASLIVVAVLLCGCGGTDKSGETSRKEEFSIDEKQLESAGYKEIAGIAYGKIENGDDRPNVYLVYRKVDPELALYLWSMISREFDLECDFVVTWNGEEYVLDEETMMQTTEDNLSEAFPPEWEGAVKEISSSTKNGKGIDYFVSKSEGDRISQNVEYFVSQYLEQQLEETQTPEPTSVETKGASKEGEESDISVSAEKTYNIGDDKFDFVFGEQDGEKRFYLYCNIKDKADAFYVNTSLNTLMNSEDENFKIIKEEFDFSYSIIVGDGAVLFRTPELLIITKDGAGIDVEDYFSAEWMASEEYHESDYGAQVMDFMIDFIENN